MNYESMGIQAGDLIRCPDRATAHWHRVVRVGRRRDGTRYIVLRRSRIWRALGLGRDQRLEWSLLKSMGYGLKRGRAAPNQPHFSSQKRRNYERWVR